jgi:hypothetical protein
MSEIYELLRGSRKDMDIFNTQSPVLPKSPTREANSLNGDGRIREEILKLTERVFLSETSCSPCRPFSSIEHAVEAVDFAQVGEALASQVEGAVV